MSLAVDPLSLVEEDLSQYSVELAVQTIKRLPLIAKALGPAQTRERLLTFIVKYAGFDDLSVAIGGDSANLDRVISDEVLAELAKALGEFLPLVGGVAFARELLDILFYFSTTQETCVREAAVASFRNLIPLMAQQDPKSPSLYMVPIVKKLSNDEWFSSKCSDTGIIPVLYKYITNEEEKALLRSIFLTICKDDTPMVRKYAYEHLGEFVFNANSKSARAELAEGIRNLMEETQENLRIIAVDVAEKVVAACKNDIDEFKDLAIPLVDHVGSEISWRVRKQLAKNIGEFSVNFPKSLTGQVLVPAYVDLLKDSESEVRIAAIKSMALFAKNVDEPAFSSGVAEVLEGILEDNSQVAKVSFSEVILDVAISCGKAATMKTFLPLIIKLMDSDVADMRGNVLDKLSVLSAVIGTSEVISNFLPKLLPLSKDPKWRVRKLVLENIVNFTRTVGVGTFETSFKPVLLEALNDSVFGVREVAAKQFPILAEIGGHEWVTTKLLPEVLNLNASSQNYLHRMVPLLIIFELLSSSVELSSDYLTKHIGPVVLKFAQDTVANVRIFTVKTLAVFVKKVDAGYLDAKLKPALMTLAQDSDSEVKLSAARVMKTF